jgi:hypothetical protein
MWFAVHVLIGFSDAEGATEEIVVEENVYVVECDTHSDAEQLGELLGERSAQASVSYLHPRPTKIENLGVRRVVAISNPDLDAETAPQHGTEVTYEVRKFANWKDVKDYRNNKTIRATFWEEQQ